MKKRILGLYAALVALAASAVTAFVNPTPDFQATARRYFFNFRSWFTTIAQVVANSISPVHAFGEQMPSPADFERFRVTDPNQSEVVRQRLYDYQLYPQAGQAQFTFFSQAIGNGKTSTPGAVAASPKLSSDTNMTVNGQLSSGMQYLIESIEVYFWPGSVSTADTYTPAKVTTDATGVLLAAAVSAVNDVNQFYGEGELVFTILNKVNTRESALRCFAPKTWMELDSSVATTASTTSLSFSQARPRGRAYYLEPMVSLQPATNFNVTINYPAARALPSGFNARMGVVFDGYLLRAAQ